jgi:hypothetical protein
MDQAALTGESLPSSKSVGDAIFSSTICKQGEAEAIGLHLLILNKIITFKYFSYRYWCSYIYGHNNYISSWCS